MHIIIDSYNLLKQLYGQNIQCNKVIDNFVRLCERYYAIKGHKIILVFDGGGVQQPVLEMQSYGFMVYSGIFMSADDWIVSYVKRNSALPLLVVTNDRELITRIEVFKVPSIETDLLYRFLLQAGVCTSTHGLYKKTNSFAVKLRPGESSEADAIMYEVAAGMDGMSGACVKDTRMIQTGSVGKKIKKNEKKLLDILKKL